MKNKKRRLFKLSLHYSVFQAHNFLTLAFFFLGAASGISFSLIVGTFSYWMLEENVPFALVGVMHWMSLPYAIKPMLPYLMKLFHPFSKRCSDIRRGWYILTLGIKLICLLFISVLIPQKQTIFFIFILGFVICLCASIEDMIVDHWRIEWVKEKTQQIGASFECIGFRIGMLIAGAGTLCMAHYWGWKQSYLITTIFSGFLGLAIFLIPQASCNIEPLRVSLRRFWKIITPGIFVTIFFFKFGDTVLNAMMAPFLQHHGLGKLDYAQITKCYGMIFFIAGSILAGIINFHKSFLLCLILQICSCIFFSIIDSFYHTISKEIFICTIGFENLTSGLVNTVFMIYITRTLKRDNVMVLFSTFYALSSLGRIIQSHILMVLAHHMSWSNLYLSAAIIPLLLLLFYKKNNLLEF